MHKRRIADRIIYFIAMVAVLKRMRFFLSCINAGLNISIIICHYIYFKLIKIFVEKNYMMFLFGWSFYDSSVCENGRMRRYGIIHFPAGGNILSCLLILCGIEWVIICMCFSACSDIDYPTDALSKDLYDMSGGRIAINNDEEFAYSQRVQLACYVSGASKMRFRNNDAMFGEWMTFKDTLEWVLPLQYGLNTVTGAFENVRGETVEYEDSIFFIERLAWQEGAYMGGAVAVSADGNTIAVGSFEGNANAVAVYRKAEVDWEERIITHDDIQVGEKFGYSVALSSDGMWLFVGAPEDDGRGAVFVYRQENGLWNFTQKLTPASQNGLFGYALSANYNGEYCSVAVYSGKRASVFKRTGVVYSPYFTVNFSTEYCYSVKMSPDAQTLVVGTNGNNTGRVYVYKSQGSGYTSSGFINGTQNGADFGSALVISDSGEYLIAGAPYYDAVEQYDDRGAVFIYRYESGSYVLKHQLTHTEGNRGDAMGKSLAVSGDGKNIFVALPFADEEATDRGGVRVYSLDGGIVLRNEYFPPDKKSKCLFGYSIAEGNGVIAIGAPFAFLKDENDRRGMVYIRRTK